MNNKYFKSITIQYVSNRDQYNHIFNELWSHFLQLNISRFPITQKISEKYFTLESLPNNITIHATDVNIDEITTIVAKEMIGVKTRIGKTRRINKVFRNLLTKTQEPINIINESKLSRSIQIDDVFHVINSNALFFRVGSSTLEMKHCGVVNIADKITCLPMTWNNVISFASDKQKLELNMWRKKIVQTMQNAMRVRNLKIIESGTPSDKATYRSDIDINIYTDDNTDITINQIFNSMFFVPNSHVDALVNNLANMFDINFYPYRNPREIQNMTHVKVSALARGNGFERLCSMIKKYDLQYLFIQEDLKSVISASNDSGCKKYKKLSNQTYVNYLGNPDAHCIYAMPLKEVYLSYGAFMHIVLGKRDALNKDWYLVSIADNLGFMACALFDEPECVFMPLVQRLKKTCKYIARIADGAYLYTSKNDKESLKELYEDATKAKLLPTNSNIRIVMKHLSVSSESDFSSWFLAVIRYFKYYLLKATELK